MPSIPRPYELTTDIRRRAEQLRMQGVRQAIRGSIAARSITAEMIAVGTITGTEIMDGALTGTEMADNAIPGDKIVNTTITGGKIATGTIVANNIAANAVTATQVQAGAITADKLDVTNLSAITANLGAITAGSMIGVTITLGLAVPYTIINPSGIRMFGDKASARFVDDFSGFTVGAARCNQPVVSGSQIVQVELDAYNANSDNNKTSSAIRVRDAGDDSELGYVRVFGTGSVAGTSAYTNNSDRSLKKNIRNVKDPLGVIKALRPRTFTRKHGDLSEAGFVAQELEPVLPDLVREHDHNGKPVKGITYDGIHAYTVGAIQELARRVEKLEG